MTTDCVHVPRRARRARRASCAASTRGRSITRPKPGFALDGQHARARAELRRVPQERDRSSTRAAGLRVVPRRRAQGHARRRLRDAATRRRCAFKETRDACSTTRTARFPLTGAHRDGRVREVPRRRRRSAASQFDDAARRATRTPHRTEARRRRARPATRPTQWATRTIEHAKTELSAGRRARAGGVREVPHGRRSPSRSRFDRCSSCHVNVHRDSVKDDCRACHTETDVPAARTFDHAARTGVRARRQARGARLPRSATQDRERGPACRSRARSSTSAASVTSARRATRTSTRASSAARATACHRPAGFAVKAFTHPKAPEFYAGQHAGVACVKCHGRRTSSCSRSAARRPRRVRARGGAVDRVRDVPPRRAPGSGRRRVRDVPRRRARRSSRPSRFAHDATQFPLTGEHQALECAKCHTTEVRAFPAGTGTAMQLRPDVGRVPDLPQGPAPRPGRRALRHLPRDAVVQDADVHAPGARPSSSPDSTASCACATCHKKQTGRSRPGTGTAIRFRVGTTCACLSPEIDHDHRGVMTLTVRRRLFAPAILPDGAPARRPDARARSGQGQRQEAEEGRARRRRGRRSGRCRPRSRASATSRAITASTTSRRKKTVALEDGAARRRGSGRHVGHAGQAVRRSPCRRRAASTSTDTAARRVFVFDPDAKTVTFLGDSGHGKLTKPIGVAVDDEGRVFVADATLNRVFGYGAGRQPGDRDRPRRRAEEPVGPGHRSRAASCSTSPTRRKHQVLCYSTVDGSHVRDDRRARRRARRIQLPDQPVRRRAQGRLYVADTLNFRIQIFDAEGEFAQTFGTQGDTPGTFNRPKGVARRQRRAHLRRRHLVQQLPDLRRRGTAAAVCRDRPDAGRASSCCRRACTSTPAIASTSPTRATRACRCSSMNARLRADHECEKHEPIL